MNDELIKLREQVTERESIETDVDGIVEIDQLSFDNCLSRAVVFEKMSKALANADRRAITCLDSDEHEVLGYMFGAFHASRHDDEANVGLSQFTISRLAVHPSTRWRYIGTSLIDHAFRIATQANSTGIQVAINVDDVSIGALMFLERMQFELSATAGILNLYERRLI
jgi:ribosomal protein S18 acetylase RimI-like enzyme